MTYEWKFVHAKDEGKADGALNNLIRLGFEIQSVQMLPAKNPTTTAPAYFILARRPSKEREVKPMVCAETGYYDPMKGVFGCGDDVTLRVNEGDSFPPCPVCWQTTAWELRKPTEEL